MALIGRVFLLMFYPSFSLLLFSTSLLDTNMHNETLPICWPPQLH